jgi:hypothetical protein
MLPRRCGAVDLLEGLLLDHRPNSPALSCQEKRGSLGSAETAEARLHSAAIGQSKPSVTRNADWISPGLAVFVDGRSRRAYNFPGRSQPRYTPLRVRRLAGSKAACDSTETLSKRIIPKKAQLATAQMQASNGSESCKVALIAHSASRVASASGISEICRDQHYSCLHRKEKLRRPD